MTMSTDHHPGVEFRPIRARVRPTDPSAQVLARLEQEGLSFAVVVASESEELLGVVLRGVLQNACGSVGHDPAGCTVRQHLKTDVDVCFRGEPVKELLNPADTGRAPSRLRTARARSRERLPIVVLDERRRPVGLRDRGR